MPLPERVSEVEQKVDGHQRVDVDRERHPELAVQAQVQRLHPGSLRETRRLGLRRRRPPGRITNFDRFLVRRGRLKATYTGENAEYLLQIDATGDGVVLKDAEATFVDTWTPLGLRFTMGQFKVPFGYEVLQSSSDREMPERAAVIRALFPGERDRGAPPDRALGVVARSWARS